MVCARECPTWCITIDSHTEVTASPTSGSRPRTTHVLDRFAIDWSLCMYCGICVEECPFDALEWADDSVPAGPELLQELASGRDLARPAHSPGTGEDSRTAPST